jgi:hypothetical protein
MVEEFALSDSTTGGEASLSLYIRHRWGNRRVFIHRDDPRANGMVGMQHRAARLFGGLGVSRWAQTKVPRLACGIDGTREITPDFLACDVCLVNTR